jgi:hypothetical protein
MYEGRISTASGDGKSGPGQVLLPDDTIAETCACVNINVAVAPGIMALTRAGIRGPAIVYFGFSAISTNAAGFKFRVPILYYSRRPELRQYIVERLSCASAINSDWLCTDEAVIDLYGYSRIVRYTW